MKINTAMPAIVLLTTFACVVLPSGTVRAEDALDRAEARARELCARMTLEEKAGELMVYDYR